MIVAVKKAVATFVFATTGVLVGSPLLNMDVASWKLVAATGLGALVNLAYRWSEQWLKTNPDDGATDFVGVLYAVALIVLIVCGLRYLGVL